MKKRHPAGSSSSTHQDTHTFSFGFSFIFSQSFYVVVPPSLALQWLSNRNCCWMWRSNMHWLRGWLASWQIVYTRSSLPLHLLHHLLICTQADFSVALVYCVCLCLCVWVGDGCVYVCIAVWFVMLFMQSICSRFDSCVSPGHQNDIFLTYIYLTAPTLWDFGLSFHTKQTHVLFLRLSISLFPSPLPLVCFRVGGNELRMSSR